MLICVITQVLGFGGCPSARAVLEESGVRMGLLDFRPQHKGWFGTFTVEKFEPLTEETEEQLAQPTEEKPKTRTRRAKKTD